MTEYFGFEVDENYEGEFLDLVVGVDPKFHEAIAFALAELCNWYGDKVYREIDEWFTVIYGVVMMTETAAECSREHPSVQLEFDLAAKDSDD